MASFDLFGRQNTKDQYIQVVAKKGEPGAFGMTIGKQTRWVKTIPNPDYGAAQGATAGAAAGAGGSGGPAPNDGQYGNIVSNLDYQAQAAKAQQDYWANKATEDANANAAKAASMEAEKAAAAAATKQQQDALQQMMIQQQTAFAQQQLLQQQQIAASNAAYEEQKQAGIQQQTAFAQQQLLQQQQIATSNAAYEEQKRGAEALARAYVPGQQATALAPMVGDQRSAVAGSGSSRNTLSSLSILTGNNSGTNASKMGSLSGLQIA